MVLSVVQSARRRMRPGQRPLSRFQAEAAESQAQGVPDSSQPAGVSAADNDSIPNLLAAWDVLELSTVLRQVSGPNSNLHRKLAM